MSYRFGPFELDPSARELRADGERVETEPKAFDLLVHLVEHRERAVSKDELLNAVWPRQIVSETALTRAIMKARRAVGDDSGRQAVIRTVHGHGYRFVAELEASPAEPLPTSDVAESPAPEPTRTHRRRYALGAILLLAVIATVVVPLRSVDEGPVAGSVAVLPVSSRLDEAEFGWVRLGLMSLLQRMLDEGGVDVVSDQRVLGAVGDDPLASPPGVDRFDELRRQTGADNLLHTTLDRQSGLHRLSAVLTYADGRKARRVIVGESPAHLAADMANVLSQLLTGYDRRNPDRFGRASTDPFVNEMYARALDLELQGRLEEARRLFRLAADQEPELFWLRYEIALCTRDLREWDEAEAQFVALREEAAAGSEPRALIATLNSFGVMQFVRTRYDEAEALYREALDAAIDYERPSERATVLVNLGLVSSRRGDFDAAAGFYDRALDAFEESGEEPTAAFLNNYAGLLMRTGEVERARGFAEQAVEGFRVMGHRRFEAPSLNRLASILRRQGDIDGAVRRHEEALSIYRDLGNEIGELGVMGSLAQAHRARGDLTRAGLLARDTLERSKQTGDRLLLGDAYMNLAGVDADLRRYEDALPSYEAALEIFRALGDAEGLHAAEAGVVEAALELGRIDQARQIAEAATAAATESGRGRDIALARLLAGRVADASGDAASAADHYAAALEFAKQSNDSPMFTRAALHLAILELERGELGLAASLVDETRAHAADDRDLLRLDARLALARGDREAAATLLEQLRRQAGEAWTPDDEALLADAQS